MKKYEEKCLWEYADMLDLPHYRDPAHPPMTVHDRAAQFSPFAALTGHDEAVKETARLTETKTELSESRIELLNRRLHILKAKLSEGCEITVEYFEPDLRKEGGQYREMTGVVRKIDFFRRELVFYGGCRIPMEDISDLKGEIFGDEPDH